MGLRRSDLKHYQIPTGPLVGRWCYDLDGSTADKCRKLGLGSNTTVRDDSFLHVIVEDPNDPYWSTYACLNRMLTTHFPPDFQHHLFCHKAPEKVLKRRRRLGDHSEAHWDLIPNKDGIGMKAKGKIGKNAPCTLFREMATRAKCWDKTWKW